MSSLSEKILGVLADRPGITDKWLAEALFGKGAAQQRVNCECRLLEQRGLLTRRKRDDGLIGNYIANGQTPSTASAVTVSIGTPALLLSEDQVKTFLQSWLVNSGWSVEIAWAKSRGIDIDARSQGARWVIEVKGGGSLQPMRVNYFLGALGELLQRMDDPHARYSVAFPDMQQFRNLWSRLPVLCKQRTGITALFVSHQGAVTELK